MNSLNEGKIYSFKIVKDITILNNDDFWVLEDIFGKKHLIEKNIYSGYQFKVGQLIDCNVDKINCQGRIFIEPIHPYYKIGESYLFEFVKKEISLNKKGKTIYSLIFTDKQKNKAVANVNKDTYNSFDKVECYCKIEKIKKATLYLKM